MLVIDGLDECVASERESLLEVLHTLVTSTPFLTIIIASRPEIDIRTTFAREPYRAITHSIRLQDFKEDSEVRLYLRDEFCRIRESHPARASIPISWPLGEILETLVLKASGNYILPSTVIKHVDNPRRSPVQLLQEVMHCFGAPNPATPTRNPLSPLDALCDMILHPPEGDVALLKQILHWLNSAPSPPRALHPKTDEARTPWVLDEVLNLDPGTTDIALCDLHSLIGISDSGSVTFHHATLHDFLDNQARSKDLFQTKRETYTDISSACATHLERWSKGPADVRDAHLYAAFLVSHTLDLLLQVEGPSGPEPFPKSLLQLDARLMVKLRFYVDEAMRTGWGEVLRVTTVQSDYFGAQAEPACSSVLARSFKRLSTSAPKLLGFIRGYKGSKRSPEGLIAFESESGLYDEPL